MILYFQNKILGGATLVKKRSFLFFIFASLFFLSSCSISNESAELFDPKTHIKETDSSEISLLQIYDYTVSSSNISSPKLNRLQIGLGSNEKLSSLSMEIIDLDSAYGYTATYDSNSDLFRIKIEENFPVESTALFDSTILQSAEKVVQNLDSNDTYSVYFLNLVSSGGVDISQLHDAEFFLLEGEDFQPIDRVDSLPPYDSIHFFAVHRGNNSEEFPSYFIVDPKKR